MQSDQWREQVGRPLEERRLSRGFSSRYQICDGVDLSESWVRQMESGEVKRNDGEIVAPNPRGNKVMILMEQLAWPSDAIDQLLEGTAPEDLPDVEPMMTTDLLTATVRDLTAEVRLLREALREGGIGPGST